MTASPCRFPPISFQLFPAFGALVFPRINLHFVAFLVGALHQHGRAAHGALHARGRLLAAMGADGLQFQAAAAANLPAFLDGLAAAGAAHVKRVLVFAEGAEPGVAGDELPALGAGLFVGGHGCLQMVKVVSLYYNELYHIWERLQECETFTAASTSGIMKEHRMKREMSRPVIDKPIGYISHYYVYT